MFFVEYLRFIGSILIRRVLNNIGTKYTNVLIASIACKIICERVLDVQKQSDTITDSEKKHVITQNIKHTGVKKVKTRISMQQWEALTALKRAN